MTDNEIIKALEFCHFSCGCSDCPYEGCITDSCMETMKSDALDLINRQQAEIDDLCKVVGRAYQENYFLKVSRKCVRAEAIKEFAERLNEKTIATAEYCEVVLGQDIDNLVKEMVGDTK